MAGVNSTKCVEASTLFWNVSIDADSLLRPSPMFVVVTNEARQDNVHGAFETHDDAERWAHKHCIGFCWRIVKLNR